MQYKSNDICKSVSKEKDIDFDLVKSIDTAIFKELSNQMRNPTNIFINVYKLGTFKFRCKKVNSALTNYDKELNKEIIPNLEKIIGLYDNYIKDKNEFKENKFGKETHRAYLLAKEQEKLSKAKEVKSE